MPDLTRSRREAPQQRQQQTLGHSAAHIGRSMSPPPLQLKGKDGSKTVTGTAMTRLKHAQDAIKYTKDILKHGAGNQLEALKATNFNSNFRLHVARKEKYWKLTPEAKKLADSNKEAYKAARAEVAQGGNCGEHANLAFQYLRHKAVGETISRGSVQGFDHAFTFVGPAGSTKDMSETAVSDPWPTAPKAVLWEDHFAKPVMDQGKPLNVRSTMVADGKNPKDLIKAGLSLTPEGKQIIAAKRTDKDTDDRITKHEGERTEKHTLSSEMEALYKEFEANKKGLDNGKFKGQAKTDKEARQREIAQLYHAKKKRHDAIKLWMWGQVDAHTSGHDYDYEEPSWMSQAWEWMKSWF